MSINKLINELKPIQDSKEQLRRHLVWMIMTRVMLFTLLIAVTVVLQSLGRNVILPPNAVTMAFLSVVFIYSIGSAGLLQTKTSHLPRFGLIQVLSDTVFSALLVLGTGCSQSIFRPIFIFPVLIGGLNLNRIGGLLAATASSVLYGAILLCEYLEYIPPFYSHTNYIPPDYFLDVVNKFAVYVVLFLLSVYRAVLLQRGSAGRKKHFPGPQYSLIASIFCISRSLMILILVSLLLTAEIWSLPAIVPLKR
ncbi:MAG: hypothetical protein D3917_12820 [Candidatus Electrothrix sp. AX5]|nr:hypothetical protein [Candidatus Electrothrix sp. AX5]